MLFFLNFVMLICSAESENLNVIPLDVVSSDLDAISMFFLLMSALKCYFFLSWSRRLSLSLFVICFISTQI